MTQTELAFDEPSATARYLSRAAAIFRAQPNQDIHWSVFAQQCGALAWRTRISECRRVLGMNIPKPKIVCDARGVKHSYYRWETQ